MTILTPIQLKQYFLLALILGLAILLGMNLYTVFPGVLGAITFYILMRERYYRLTVMRGWKKWVTALLFLLIALVIFILPFMLLVAMVAPTATARLNNPQQVTTAVSTITGKIQHVMPGFTFGEPQIKSLLQRVTASLPGFLSGAGTTVTNLLICFFLLYFLLVDGRRIERALQDYIPLKEENVDSVWQATRTMVVSNAIGIPVLAMCQALVACIGFKIFGIDNWMLWGVLAGLCSVLPVVGTAIVCIPLCVYLMATGHMGAGIGLLVYSVAVIGSIDNVLRFTLLKRIGDVHPAVTVFGILVGVPIFGFMGLIFGPLLISYLLLLVKIYRVEFSARHLVRGDSK